MRKKDTAKSGGDGGDAKENRDSFLETVESFIVAFILAFVFRAYVVEAFVIPTGSMASQLNGEHFEFTCANCGYPYHTGIDQPQDGRPLPYTIHAAPICPLCFNHEVAGRPLTDGVVSVNARERFMGDRILVMKYYYDFFPPERWDVIVFKYPLGPQDNYIKRLVGLPNERVEIKGGDLYINDEIADKTDLAQNELWMPVYDTSYPDTAHENDPRWQAAAGNLRSPLVPFKMPLVLVPPENGDPAWLTYHHRDEDGRPGPIRDFYAYDAWTSTSPAGTFVRQDGRDDVTDVRLRADVKFDAAGTAEILLRAYADQFRFLVPTADSGQEVRIIHEVVTDGRTEVKEVVGGPKDMLPLGEVATVEAAMVDHKVVLMVNGRRVIDRNGDGRLNREDDYRYEPSVPRSAWTKADKDRWTEIRLGALGSPMEAQRLRIDRDIFYMSIGAPGGGSGTEGNPQILGPDEFMVFGDNSPRSADSRWWIADNILKPTIPRQNLIGKAFFVYWPAAGARYKIPVGIVPDVKAFRMIH